MQPETLLYVQPEQDKGAKIEELIFANGWRADIFPGFFELRNKSGEIIIPHATASITTDQGEARLDQMSVEVKKETNGITFTGEWSGKKVSWKISTVGDFYGWESQLIIENNNEPMQLESICLLHTDCLFPNSLINEISVSHPGWQSWSSDGSLESSFDSAVHFSPPPVKNYGMAPGDKKHNFPWMTQFFDKKERLLLGFSSAENFFGSIEVDSSDNPAVSANLHTEGIFIPGNQQWQSEKMVGIINNCPAEARDQYTRTVAANMQPRFWKGHRYYWCSWYEGFAKVTPEYIKKNIDKIRDLVYQYPQLEQMPFIVDDGWEITPGEWRPNEKFKYGWENLAPEIKAAGVTPGIWLAPFTIASTSELAGNHPDWLIKDKRGEPTVAKTNVWNDKAFALDITHPEAEEWLRQNLREIKNWGYEIYKCDFLYCGALTGKRYNTGLTSVQAYRRGLEILREELGDEAQIIACGAPFLPSIGLVDAMRISTDTMTRWDGYQNKDGTSGGLKYALSSIIAHNWMKNWFTPDLDCLTVRNHETELTPEEISTFISVYQLNEGLVGLGDDLSRLEPDRRQLIYQLITTPQLKSVPEGPYVEGIPERLVVKEGDRIKYMGLFNWKDEDRKWRLDKQFFGEGNFEIFDWVTGEKIQITPEMQEMQLKKHAARIIRSIE
jgi:alpha-galactosidase